MKKFKQQKNSNRNIRLFYPDLADKTLGNRIAIRDDVQLAHLKVLRISKYNYNFIISDGEGLEVSATLEKQGREGLLFSLVDVINDAELDMNWEIALPIIKQSALEQAISQLTQFGVFSRIRLYYSDYTRLTERRYSSNKIKRLEGIVLNSFSQSGALILPKIDVIPEGGGIEEILVDAGYNTVLKPDLAAPILDAGNLQILVPKKVKVQDKTLVVLGSEGGFSDQENQILVSSPKQDVISFRLPGTVLTTETAVVAVTTILKLLK